MIPDKLPKLPKKLFNQEWTISIEQGISEDGEPLPAATANVRCWFNGKAYQVFNAQKQLIRLSGKLIALGNVFPSLPEISTGEAKNQADVVYKIYRCERALNPDGSVYVTVLELM